MNINPKVDKYLVDGCMRCKFGATPKCKVNRWIPVLKTLRQIVLETGLVEDIKWGVPVYMHEQKNIILISALKNYAFLSFFKGSLLDDKHKILAKQGENTQVTRIIRYTDAEQVLLHYEAIKEYIIEAIAIEKSDKKSIVEKNLISLPDELIVKFEEYPELKKAFYALTPGRQRGYLIYFSEAKQAQSRVNRIEKYKEKIINGEGINDAYMRERVKKY